MEGSVGEHLAGAGVVRFWGRVGNLLGAWQKFGGVGRLSTPQGESVATALVRWGVPYNGRG